MLLSRLNINQELQRIILQVLVEDVADIQPIMGTPLDHLNTTIVYVSVYVDIGI